MNISKKTLCATIITSLVLTVAAWGQTFTESVGVITFTGQGRLTEIEPHQTPLVQQGDSREFLRIPRAESSSRFPEFQKLNWMVRYQTDDRDQAALGVDGFQLHRLRVQGQSRLLLLDKKNLDGLPLKATRIGRDHLRLEPENSLAPGEYALVYQPKSSEATVYCFAVDGPPQGRTP